MGFVNNNFNLPPKEFGGTHKIGDIPKVCTHPEHNPPTHMYLSPGIYEHVCPGCGGKIIFTVPAVTC